MECLPRCVTPDLIIQICKVAADITHREEMLFFKISLRANGRNESGSNKDKLIGGRGMAGEERRKDATRRAGGLKQGRKRQGVRVSTQEGRGKMRTRGGGEKSGN